MKALILAAGMGKRLQEASGGLPKSMIKIGDRTIIHNQIQSCLEVGILEFIFVLGFKQEQMQEHILQILNKDQVTFIENPIYSKTNTLYSLYLTTKNWDDDFIYFFLSNSDIKSAMKMDF